MTKFRDRGNLIRKGISIGTHKSASTSAPRPICQPIGPMGPTMTYSKH